MATQATGPVTAEIEALRTFYGDTNGATRESKWLRTDGWLNASDLKDWEGVRVDVDKRVIWLAINQNQITGTLPTCLGDLQMLQKLRLNGNNLTGSIPLQLGRLSMLRVLSLSQNNLTGSIPDQLSTLHELEDLILTRNELTGTIPNFLSSFSRLRNLSLSANKFTGPIPSLDGLSNLNMLDLSKNLLTGTVPKSLWQLQELTFLKLHLNRLERMTDEVNGPAAGEEVDVFLQKIEDTEYLNFDSNPWELPPASVVVKGRESIRSYYEAWKSVENISLIRALKVVFVGTASAGKTSLMRSIRAGRGDRTTHDEGDPSTVGVDLHTHMLQDNTRCKLYDLAGQLDYRGLHQLFLTEWALYIVVFDAKFFEGKVGDELTKATETHLVDWIILLHLRLTVCTVQLVATHCDLLEGSDREKDELVQTVGNEFRRQHEKWKSDRRQHNDAMDTQMVVFDNVISVGCCLRSETKVDRGLTLIRVKIEKSATRSYIPQSWVEARTVLDAIGGETEQAGNPIVGREPTNRAWAMREDIHAKFVEAITTLDASNPVSRLCKVAAHDAMEGAIELRAFSGLLLSRDNYVFLDVAYIAAALKPILNHKIDERGPNNVPRFSGKELVHHRLPSGAELSSMMLLICRDDLVKGGILRREFASFLWEDPARTQAVPQKSLQGILEELGVAIPLPQSPAAEDVERAAGGGCCPPCGMQLRCLSPCSFLPYFRTADESDCTDLLVLMRLKKQPAQRDRDGIAQLMGGTTRKLRAEWKFGFGGAPYGFPEEVIALCHRLGDSAPTIYWRHGALFSREECGVPAKAKALVTYDEVPQLLVFETSGQEEWDFVSLRFAVSAVRHVTVKFQGVFWEGRVVCWQHPDECMYHLAGSEDRLNGPRAAFEADIVPHKKHRTEQDNSCDERDEGCALPLEKFGRTVNVLAPIGSPAEVTGTASSPDTAETGSSISPRQNAFLGVVTAAASIMLPVGLVEGPALAMWIGIALFVFAAVLALKRFNLACICCF